jgi:hypothetical protein
MARKSTRLYLLGALTLAGGTAGAANEVPRYDHILVIISENHSYQEIIGSPRAPNLNRLAKTYGIVTNFCGLGPALSGSCERAAPELCPYRAESVQRHARPPGTQRSERQSLFAAAHD